MSTTRIIAGILLALTSARGLSQQQSSRTIQGTIFIAGTDQPISDAQVTLTKSANSGSFPPMIAPVRSDSRGAFSFRNLDTGSYRLTVMKNGYVREDNSLTLTSSEPVSSLSIRLTPTATLSGHVRDASGRPVAGVAVQLLRRAYDQNGLRPQEVFSTESNDLGEYRIFGIDPGRYYLAAGTTDSSAYLHRLEGYLFDKQVLDGENGVLIDYGQTFYPGVANMGKASALDLQPGSHRANLDLTVTRQRLFTVRGNVTLSTTGLPPSHLNWSGSFGDSHYDARTGRFEVTGLPGEYAFTIESESLRAFVNFAVSNSDIDGLRVVLEPPAMIHGRIEVEGALPAGAELQRIHVQLRRPEMGDYEGSSANVESDGAFRLEDVPVGREYRVVVSGLPSGFYLKAARLGGADALENFVNVTRAIDVDLLISSSAAQVRGVVTGVNLQPLVAAEVVLIPERARYRTELFKSTRTGRDGRFTFSGVPPGDYKLFAWEALDRGAFYDSEILALFEDRGTPIHLSESSEQSMDLKAIPSGNVP